MLKLSVTLNFTILPTSFIVHSPRNLLFMMLSTTSMLRIQCGRLSNSPHGTRTLFNFFKKPAPPAGPFHAAPPVLSQDDLFHVLAKSPFADLRERAERIRTVSICPVSLEKYNERVRPLFDCPDCGWPTHRSEERWREDQEEHSEVCTRLREVNEDDHDLRSGRRMTEFENMPRKHTVTCGLTRH